jgi:peptide chain release factor 3
MRICSGRFEKDMMVQQTRTKKTIKLAQPQQFLAQDRNSVEEAYAGDIIGIFDPGVFSIGDTLCDAKRSFSFEGIPMFPAEHFAAVSIKDAMKRKQFLKGMEQISQEGAIQLFKRPDSAYDSLIVGVVGVLQFEVLEYRLKNEYGVDIRIETLPFVFARWTAPEKLTPDKLGFTGDAMIVQDQFARQVVLFASPWIMNRITGNNTNIEFMEIPPAYLG